MPLALAIWSALTAKPWFQGGPTVLTQKPGEINIVYVEGMNADGTPNANRFNEWNDARLILQWVNGALVITKQWVGTTEPGKFYTEHPMNVGGAAHIALGQYQAWRVGIHRPGTPGAQEALVQAGRLTITRDRDETGRRSGGPTQVGAYFGIDQHHGFNMSMVNNASAGCLVGQSIEGHREFMAIVKTDPRFLADRNYLFHTAIIPYADVQAFLVSKDPAIASAAS